MIFQVYGAFIDSERFHDIEAERAILEEEEDGVNTMPKYGIRAKPEPKAAIHNSSSRIFSSIDEYINESESFSVSDWTTSPDILDCKMSTKDLLKAAHDIILKKFSFLNACLLTRPYMTLTDFLNFVVLLNSLKDETSEETLNELLPLWGYYLTLQDEPSSVALKEMKEVLQLPCFAENCDVFSIRYHQILAKLIKICKLNNILNSSDKKELRSSLESIPIFDLKVGLISYLYELDKQESRALFKIAHDDGSGGRFISVRRFSGWRRRHELEKMMIIDTIDSKNSH